MTSLRDVAACLLTLALLALPAASGAQTRSRLSVLRFEPSRVASPGDSLVIAFDHPVAPRLGRSVDPASVVRITPAAPSHAYWRDPSTLVVTFDEPLPYGARFGVAFDPALRAAGGARLAPGQDRAIEIRASEILAVEPSRRADGFPSTLQRLRAIYESPVALDRLADRAWMRGRNCPGQDSIPLTAESIAPLGTDEMRFVRGRDGRAEDPRVHALRRVVRFVAAAELPRGCEAQVHLPLGETGTGTHIAIVRTAPPFRVDSIVVGGGSGLTSSAAPLNHAQLHFSLPVAAHEVRRAVTVAGRPATVSDSPYQSRQSAERVWRLGNPLAPGRSTEIVVAANAMSLAGDTLGTTVRRTLTRPHLPPSVSIPYGLVVMPRASEALLVARHVNVDSVLVEIGRVPDSLWARALSVVGMSAVEAWTRLRVEAVAHTVAASRVPLDSAGLLVLSESLIPPTWRGDPVLLVRTRGIVRPAPASDTGRVDGVTPPARVASVPIAAVRSASWPATAVVQRTNLAVHAVSYEGATEVWVTSLATARSVARARVRLLDRHGVTLASAMTDARGRARIDEPAIASPDTARMRLLDVATADDRVVLAVPRPGDATEAEDDDEGPRYDRGAVRPTRIRDGRQLHGAAFSERGIYRPGERVFLKGIARTFAPYGDFATPAGDSARWTITWVGEVNGWMRYYGSGERLQRRPTVLTSFGTSVDTFDIPRSAPLGQYDVTLALRTGGSWRVAARTSFAVAEYRAAEFALTLDADTSATLFAGDTVKVRATAKYLFGMPMDGGVVTASSLMEELPPWESSTHGLEGYQVGRSWWRLPVEQIGGFLWTSADSTRLDAAGSATFALSIGNVSRAGRMRVSVMATDANRQTVSAQRTLRVHAADAYVGMRMRGSRWWWNVGDSIPVDLLVVGANGVRRAGAPVRLVALRHRWADNRWTVDTVWRSGVTSASEPVRAAFRPATSGRYELLAIVRDAQGRTSTTGLDMWVLGGAAGPDARRTITISPDRRSYSPGDVATVVMDSPIEQRAWITLSRSVPLHEQMVALRRGPNVVQIPVPSEAMPSAEIRVVGIVPLEADRGERESLLGTATAPITVGIESRRLGVTVEPDRATYAPGEEVRVRVQVSDRNGKGRRAETTIWAVDEGVGLLTALERPDVAAMLLGAAFASPWSGSSLTGAVIGLSSSAWSRRDGVMIRIRGASSLSGRLGANYLESVVVTAYGIEPPKASLRSLFSTTPLFAGAVVTDSNGVAETSFTLAGNVTTYRLFATAVSSGMESGSGDTTFVSTRPLIVRPALPRIVRLGDTLLAGGVMTQDAAGRTPVSLRIEGSGVEIGGPLTRSDTLVGRRAGELRFPMRVVSSDSVTVRLRGGSAADGDAVQLTLPVKPAGHARAHVVSGTLEGRVDLALPAVEGIDVERSLVALQLGTSLLPLARQLSEALRVYPYWCTEQLSSAGRALLARVALERAIDPAATMSARDREQLEHAVSRIVSRQQDDGGFGYWSRDGWTSPWLTAYALEMLFDARAAGVAVPALVIEHATKYLARQPVSADFVSPASAPHAGRFHDAVAVARVLRRVGAPSEGRERALVAAKGHLPYVDRLELALLRAAAGDSGEARALVDAAWGAAKPSGRKIVLDDSTAGWGWLFESRLRPMARLLQTTATLQPKHPLLGALLESVVQRGSAARGWRWNTLDQSAVAEAIVAAREVYGFGAARRVEVSGPSGALATSRFESGRSDSLGFRLGALLRPRSKDTTPRLGLAADSSAPIYYAATLFETPLARPVRADDEGIGVERWYEGYDDAKPIISVREGDLVRVRLRISVKSDRDFVAVEDPIPAGLEAVDLTLRTSSLVRPGRGSATDTGWWSPWEHKELRDDRVLYFARQLRRGSHDLSYIARATTVGTFVRPPAHAEEMYNPAVHGRSDGGSFTVTEAK